MKRFMATVLSCTFIGVGIAGLFGLWNTQGIIIDDYITATLTITDLQTGVIFIWALVGVILGVARR